MGGKVLCISCCRKVKKVTRTNTLKIRRLDVLEQLEERFAVMTKEKDKYDKTMVVYRAACDKYEQDVENWESRIPALLEGMVRDSKVTLSNTTSYYNRRYSEDSWSANIEVSVTRSELEKKIGAMPKKPECPDTPSFLRESWGYKSNQPCVYNAVYQAIQLLNMSDDETVPASMYQLALEVL